MQQAPYVTSPIITVPADVNLAFLLFLDAAEELGNSLFNDVCDGACKHLQTFRHLKSHHFCAVLPYVVYGLVYLERVI